MKEMEALSSLETLSSHATSQHSTPDDGAIDSVQGESPQEKPSVLCTEAEHAVSLPLKEPDDVQNRDASNKPTANICLPGSDAEVPITAACEDLTKTHVDHICHPSNSGCSKTKKTSHEHGISMSCLLDGSVAKDCPKRQECLESSKQTQVKDTESVSCTFPSGNDSSGSSPDSQDADQQKTATGGADLPKCSGAKNDVPLIGDAFIECANSRLNDEPCAMDTVTESCVSEDAEVTSNDTAKDGVKSANCDAQPKDAPKIALKCLSEDNDKLCMNDVIPSFSTVDDGIVSCGESYDEGYATLNIDMGCESVARDESSLQQRLDSFDLCMMDGGEPKDSDGSALSFGKSSDVAEPNNVPSWCGSAEVLKDLPSTNVDLRAKSEVEFNFDLSVVCKESIEMLASDSQNEPISEENKETVLPVPESDEAASETDNVAISECVSKDFTHMMSAENFSRNVAHSHSEDQFKSDILRMDQVLTVASVFIPENSLCSSSAIHSGPISELGCKSVDQDGLNCVLNAEKCNVSASSKDKTQLNHAKETVDSDCSVQRTSLEHGDCKQRVALIDSASSICITAELSDKLPKCLSTCDSIPNGKHSVVENMNETQNHETKCSVGESGASISVLSNTKCDKTDNVRELNLNKVPAISKENESSEDLEIVRLCLDSCVDVCCQIELLMETVVQEDSLNPLQKSREHHDQCSQRNSEIKTVSCEEMFFPCGGVCINDVHGGEVACARMIDADDELGMCCEDSDKCEDVSVCKSEDVNAMKNITNNPSPPTVSSSTDEIKMKKESKGDETTDLPLKSSSDCKEFRMMKDEECIGSNDASHCQTQSEPSASNEAKMELGDIVDLCESECHVAIKQCLSDICQEIASILTSEDELDKLQESSSSDSSCGQAGDNVQQLPCEHNLMETNLPNVDLNISSIDGCEVQVELPSKKDKDVSSSERASVLVDVQQDTANRAMQETTNETHVEAREVEKMGEELSVNSQENVDCVVTVCEKGHCAGETHLEAKDKCEQLDSKSADKNDEVISQNVLQEDTAEKGTQESEIVAQIEVKKDREVCGKKNEVVNFQERLDNVAVVSKKDHSQLSENKDGHAENKSEENDQGSIVENCLADLLSQVFKQEDSAMEDRVKTVCETQIEVQNYKELKGVDKIVNSQETVDPVLSDSHSLVESPEQQHIENEVCHGDKDEISISECMGNPLPQSVLQEDMTAVKLEAMNMVEKCQDVNCDTRVDCALTVSEKDNSFGENSEHDPVQDDKAMSNCEEEIILGSIGNKHTANALSENVLAKEETVCMAQVEMKEPKERKNMDKVVNSLETVVAVSEKSRPIKQQLDSKNCHPDNGENVESKSELANNPGNIECMANSLPQCILQEDTAKEETQKAVNEADANVTECQDVIDPEVEIGKQVNSQEKVDCVVAVSEKDGNLEQHLESKECHADTEQLENKPEDKNDSRSIDVENIENATKEKLEAVNVKEYKDTEKINDIVDSDKTVDCAASVKDNILDENSERYVENNECHTGKGEETEEGNNSESIEKKCMIYPLSPNILTQEICKEEMQETVNNAQIEVQEEQIIFDATEKIGCEVVNSQEKVDTAVTGSKKDHSVGECSEQHSEDKGSREDIDEQLVIESEEKNNPGSIDKKCMENPLSQNALQQDATEETVSVAQIEVKEAEEMSDANVKCHEDEATDAQEKVNCDTTVSENDISLVESSEQNLETKECNTKKDEQLLSKGEEKNNAESNEKPSLQSGSSELIENEDDFHPEKNHKDIESQSVTTLDELGPNVAVHSDKRLKRAHTVLKVPLQGKSRGVKQRKWSSRNDMRRNLRKRSLKKYVTSKKRKDTHSSSKVGETTEIRRELPIRIPNYTPRGYVGVNVSELTSSKSNLHSNSQGTLRIADSAIDHNPTNTHSSEHASSRHPAGNENSNMEELDPYRNFERWVQHLGQLHFPRLSYLAAVKCVRLGFAGEGLFDIRRANCVNPDANDSTACESESEGHKTKVETVKSHSSGQRTSAVEEAIESTENKEQNQQLSTAVSQTETVESEPLPVADKTRKSLGDANTAASNAIKAPDKQVDSNDSVSSTSKTTPKKKPRIVGDKYFFQLVEELHVVKLPKGQKLFTCDICAGVYQRAFSLKRHFLRSHVNYKYLTDRDISNCGIIVGDKVTLHGRVGRSSRAVVNNAKQKLCNEQEESDNLVQNRKRKREEGTQNSESEDCDTLPDLYRCYSCGLCFDDKDDLKYHLRNHPQPENVEKPHVCDRCDASFPDKHNLARHQISHSTRVYTCLYCDKNFTSTTLWKRHNNLHENAQTHYCFFCKMEFTVLTELRKHLSTEHEDQYHCCILCDDRFDSRSALEQHLEEHKQPLLEPGAHSKDQKNDSVPTQAEDEKTNVESDGQTPASEFKYTCGVCQKMFTNYVNMCRHRRLAHGTVGKHGRQRTSESIASSQSSSRSQSPSLDVTVKTDTPPPIVVEQEQTMEEIPLDPETRFYIQIADNIRENLMNYLDGKLSSESGDEGKKSIVSNGERSGVSSKVSWEKYNFPKDYNSRATTIEVLSQLDISTQLAMQQHIEKVNSSSEIGDSKQGSASSKCEGATNKETVFPQGLSLVENKSQGSSCKVDSAVPSTEPETDVCATEESAQESNPEEEGSAEETDTDRKGRIELSGEWIRPRSYICCACAEKFGDLWELEDHKYLAHPNVWCTHFELEESTNVPEDLYKCFIKPVGMLHSAIVIPATPALESKCTKCSKLCASLSDLHRHMLECGGDHTWMISPAKRKKWRPFGSRRRRQQGRRGMKRNIPNTPVKLHRPRNRYNDSTNDTIQRMIANLPPKRATRRVIQFSEDEIKTRSQATIHSITSPNKISRTWKVSRSSQSSPSHPQQQKPAGKDDTPKKLRLKGFSPGKKMDASAVSDAVASKAGVPQLAVTNIKAKLKEKLNSDQEEPSRRTRKSLKGAAEISDSSANEDAKSFEAIVKVPCKKFLRGGRMKLMNRRSGFAWGVEKHEASLEDNAVDLEDEFLRKKFNRLEDHFICQGCGLEFENGSAFDRHGKKCIYKKMLDEKSAQSKEPNAVKDSLTCEYCDKQFVYSSALEKHARSCVSSPGLSTVPKDQPAKSDMDMPKLQKMEPIPEKRETRSNKEISDIPILSPVGVSDGNGNKKKSKKMQKKNVKKKGKTSKNSKLKSTEGTAVHAANNATNVPATGNKEETANMAAATVIEDETAPKQKVLSSIPAAMSKKQKYRKGKHKVVPKSIQGNTFIVTEKYPDKSQETKVPKIAPMRINISNISTSKNNTNQSVKAGATSKVKKYQLKPAVTENMVPEEELNLRKKIAKSKKKKRSLKSLKEKCNVHIKEEPIEISEYDNGEMPSDGQLLSSTDVKQEVSVPPTMKQEPEDADLFPDDAPLAIILQTKLKQTRRAGRDVTKSENLDSPAIVKGQANALSNLGPRVLNSVEHINAGSSDPSGLKGKKRTVKNAGAKVMGEISALENPQEVAANIIQGNKPKGKKKIGKKIAAKQFSELESSYNSCALNPPVIKDEKGLTNADVEEAGTLLQQQEVAALPSGKSKKKKKISTIPLCTSAADSLNSFTTSVKSTSALKNIPKKKKQATKKGVIKIPAFQTFEQIPNVLDVDITNSPLRNIEQCVKKLATAAEEQQEINKQILPQDQQPVVVPLPTNKLKKSKKCVKKPIINKTDDAIINDEVAIIKTPNVKDENAESRTEPLINLSSVSMEPYKHTKKNKKLSHKKIKLKSMFRKQPRVAFLPSKLVDECSSAISSLSIISDGQEPALISTQPGNKTNSIINCHVLNEGQLVIRQPLSSKKAKKSTKVSQIGKALGGKGLTTEASLLVLAAGENASSSTVSIQTNNTADLSGQKVDVGIQFDGPSIVENINTEGGVPKSPSPQKKSKSRDVSPSKMKSSNVFTSPMKWETVAQVKESVVSDTFEGKEKVFIHNKILAVGRCIYQGPPVAGTSDSVLIPGEGHKKNEVVNKSELLSDTMPSSNDQPMILNKVFNYQEMVSLFGSKKETADDINESFADKPSEVVPDEIVNHVLNKSLKDRNGRKPSIAVQYEEFKKLRGEEITEHEKKFVEQNKCPFCTREFTYFGYFKKHVVHCHERYLHTQKIRASSSPNKYMNKDSMAANEENNSVSEISYSEINKENKNVTPRRTSDDEGRETVLTPKKITQDQKSSPANDVFWCEICSKSYSSAFNLSKHKNSQKHKHNERQFSRNDASFDSPKLSYLSDEGGNVSFMSDSEVCPDASVGLAKTVANDRGDNEKASLLNSEARIQEENPLVKMPVSQEKEEIVNTKKLDQLTENFSMYENKIVNTLQEKKLNKEATRSPTKVFFEKMESGDTTDAIVETKTLSELTSPEKRRNDAILDVFKKKDASKAKKSGKPKKNIVKKSDIKKHSKLTKNVDRKESSMQEEPKPKDNKVEEVNLDEILKTTCVEENNIEVFLGTTELGKISEGKMNVLENKGLSELPTDDILEDVSEDDEKIFINKVSKTKKARKESVKGFLEKDEPSKVVMETCVKEDEQEKLLNNAIETNEHNETSVLADDISTFEIRVKSQDELLEPSKEGVSSEKDNLKQAENNFNIANARPPPDGDNVNCKDVNEVNVTPGFSGNYAPSQNKRLKISSEADSACENQSEPGVCGAEVSESNHGQFASNPDATPYNITPLTSSSSNYLEANIVDSSKPSDSSYVQNSEGNAYSSSFTELTPLETPGIQAYSGVPPQSTDTLPDSQKDMSYSMYMQDNGGTPMPCDWQQMGSGWENSDNSWQLQQNPMPQEPAMWNSTTYPNPDTVNVDNQSWAKPQQPEYYADNLMPMDSSLGSILDSVNQVLDDSATALETPPVFDNSGMQPYMVNWFDGQQNLEELQAAMGATDEEMAMLQQLGEGSFTSQDFVYDNNMDPDADPTKPLENPEIMDLDNQVKEDEKIEQKNATVPEQARASKRILEVRRHNSECPNATLEKFLSQYEKKEMVCPICNRHFLGLQALETHISWVHKMKDPKQKILEGTEKQNCLVSRAAEGFDSSKRKLACFVCKELYSDVIALNRHIAQLHLKRREDAEKDGGLKSQMSTALGGLLDRALTNMLGKAGLNKSESSDKDRRISFPKLNLLGKSFQNNEKDNGEGKDTAAQAISIKDFQNVVKNKFTQDNEKSSSETSNQKSAMDRQAQYVMNRPYVCHICGDRFQAAGSRNRHISLAHKNKPDAPRTSHSVEMKRPCGILLADSDESSNVSTDDVRRESSSDTESQKGVLPKCPFCPATCVSSSSLASHIETMHKVLLAKTWKEPQPEVLLKCPVCAEYFKQFHLLCNHISILHSDWNMFNFTSSSFHRLVLKKESPEESVVIQKKYPVILQQPGYRSSFLTASEVRPDRPLEHNRDGDFQCSACNLTFKASEDFKSHMDSVHSTEAARSSPAPDSTSGLSQEDAEVFSQSESIVPTAALQKVGQKLRSSSVENLSLVPCKQEDIKAIAEAALRQLNFSQRSGRNIKNSTRTARKPSGAQASESGSSSNETGDKSTVEASSSVSTDMKTASKPKTTSKATPKVDESTEPAKAKLNPKVKDITVDGSVKISEKLKTTKRTVFSSRSEKPGGRKIKVLKPIVDVYEFEDEEDVDISFKASFFCEDSDEHSKQEDSSSSVSVASDKKLAEDKNKYVCNECNKEHKSLSELTKHIKNNCAGTSQVKGKQTDNVEQISPTAKTQLKRKAYDGEMHGPKPKTKKTSSVVCDNLFREVESQRYPAENITETVLNAEKGNSDDIGELTPAITVKPSSSKFSPATSGRSRSNTKRKEVSMPKITSLKTKREVAKRFIKSSDVDADSSSSDDEPLQELLTRRAGKNKGNKRSKTEEQDSVGSVSSDSSIQTYGRNRSTRSLPQKVKKSKTCNILDDNSTARKLDKNAHKKNEAYVTDLNVPVNIYARVDSRSRLSSRNASKSNKDDVFDLLIQDLNTAS